MFIADAALGRLVTWLRLLGYDTVYAREEGIAALLRRARAEQRILLTRNRRVALRRDPPPYVLVRSDHFREQLRQVMEACGGAAAPAFLVRCSRCNARLERIEPATACATVPRYVCETQTAFARCPDCGRVYWPATHVDRMRRELERMGMRQDTTVR
jgi:uncharacterized protein with PIN domain